jgi:hypothetical protein
LWYNYSNGSWTKEGLIEIPGYSGNDPLQMIVHYYNASGQETGKHRTDFFYQGTLLIKEIHYTFNNGNWQYHDTYKYTYTSNGNIMQSLYYTDTLSSATYKEAFTWSGSTLSTSSSMLYQNNSWIDDYKDEFVYSNGKCSKSSSYTMNNGNWEVSSITSFEYNSSGNFSKESWSYSDPNNIYSDVINYESGAGNFRIFVSIIWGDS